MVRIMTSRSYDASLKMKLSLLVGCSVILLALVILPPEQPVANADDGVEPASYLPAIANPNVFNLPILFGPTHEGEGTYYNANGEGNCLFPASPNNLMVAAMNHADYNNSQICGAFIRVWGPHGNVDVRIVDRCPECPEGDVDMSPEAFSQIAPIPWGRVPITWQLLSYPLDGPIIYHFKDGSNQWWTAVQIRNHRNPIASVEYWDNGGWINLPRMEWNYFVAASGMGPGPYTFRVTDILGNQITDSGIPHVEDGDVQGGDQFPPP